MLFSFVFVYFYDISIHGMGFEVDSLLLCALLNMRRGCELFGAVVIMKITNSLAPNNIPMLNT